MGNGYIFGLHSFVGLPACSLVTIGKCLWILGVSLEKLCVYRMMWKLFCGNSIVNRYGTNECLKNIRHGQTSLAAV